MEERREQQQAEPFPEAPSLIVVKEATTDLATVAVTPADWQGYDPELLSAVMDD